MAEQPRYRDSRFWKNAPQALWIAGALAGAVVAFRPGSVEAAMGMFGGVVMVIFGGAAATNWRERSPEFQTAVAAREQQTVEAEADKAKVEADAEAGA